MQPHPNIIPLTPSSAIPRTQGVCTGCRNAAGLGFDFTMAFQPIIDMASGSVFAHEALVRGTQGQGAASILRQVDETNRYVFDQACRVKAIELAAGLGMQSRLSINFLPNAVYRAEACIRLTLETAERHGFPVENIMFELTEDERCNDLPHLKSIFSEYRRRGFLTAIDDFGAGYAGFNLLASFQPDIVKIDMELIRGIATEPARQSIVGALVRLCRDIGSRPIAEGVETADEFSALRDLGIDLFQGYLFAKPALQALATPAWWSAGSPAARFSA